MKSLAIKNSIFATFTRFAKDCAGNVTIITGLAAIPVIAAAGIAIDYSRGTRVESELQQIADAAALAAAAGQNISGTIAQKQSQRTAIAQSYLNAHLASLGDAIIVGSPAITIGPNTVDVAINANVDGSLVNVLNAPDAAGKTMTVSVHSKAAFSKDSYLCLLSTNMSEPESIYFQGNSVFTASVCTVQANSNHAIAMRTWGNAYAEAEGFCAVGGWSGSAFVPAPESGCTTKLDPYANLVLPTVGACDFNNKVVKNTTATLNPGVYCGGLSLRTHGVANLQPGLYIIKDGDLSVDSQSTLNAPVGVVFYLTGNLTNVDITSGATVTINAPKTGLGVNGAENYAGFAFMQDRTTGIGNINYISSGGYVNINGAFYAPNANLTVWANGIMNGTSSYFPVIASKFQMNGTATLYVKLDYTAAGYPEPTALKTEGKILLTQ
ncbi:MAG: TadE/TadG family type IV pilus assembly protein [Hyphomicrobiales bacterium]